MREYDFLEEFSENLKYLMKEKNVTQSELAYKSNVTKMTIGRYLNGKSMPSAKVLVNIGYALDCEIDDLIPTCELICD